MKGNFLTNVLLIVLILISLFNLFAKGPVKEAAADTFRLDTCITTKADENPSAYLHVVTH